MYTPLAQLFGLVALGPRELADLGLAGLAFGALAWASMAAVRAYVTAPPVGASPT
jgi:hypothetical protein